MQINAEEIRTTREVAREINSIIDALNKGDVEKIVVMNRAGRMAAIIVSPQRYDAMTEAS